MQEISLAIFLESRKKKLVDSFPFMAGMHAKESMISFCTLLSLAKKRFTRVNKDNDKHTRGAHKCPYIEQLHDIKILYK